MNWNPLSSPYVEIKGAKKVLVMSKRDDEEDLRKSEELKKQMDLQRFLKQKQRQELSEQRTNEAIKKRKTKALKARVKAAEKKLEAAKRDLEEFLNA